METLYEYDVIYCQTVTGRTTLTVINKSLAKKATCGLQNLSTLTCSHKGRDQKYTLTATGSNEYLVWTLRTISNKSICYGLC